MTECPFCDEELEQLDENILEELEEIQGAVNCGRYVCPNCNNALLVYIRVDFVEAEQ